MLKVGRNRPCPCGSGLKYKKCCLPRQTEDQQFNRLMSDLRERLLLFGEEVYGKDLIDEAWRDFWEEEPRGHWQGNQLFDLFSGWFAFLWIPEQDRDIETGGGPHPGTLAAYLLDSGPPLGPAERTLLEAARQEPLSFWEVESVDGQGLARLHDLVLGRRVELRLPPSHDWLDADCIVLGQVVPVGGTNVLGALSPPLNPGIFREPLQKASAVLREERGVRTPRDLLTYDLNILHLTQRMVEALLDPRFTNTDGEQVVFTWSVYSFEPSRRAELMGLMRSMRNLQYLGDTLDPLGSGEDGEQLALDLDLSGPARPFRAEDAAEDEEGEEEEPGGEITNQKLLPFPGTTRYAHEQEEEEDAGLDPSEQIEQWLDMETKERPAFMWRLRRPGSSLPETTLARIHVSEDSLLTVTNSLPRDHKLRLRLGRNAGHVLTYLGSTERSMWQVAAEAFADDED